MKEKYWNILLITYLIFFGAGCFLIGKSTNFFVFHNDFFWNLFTVQHLNINEPASFYNGFFPVGYPIFLKMLSIGNIFITAYLANILFGLVMLGAVAYLTYVTVGPGWALFCTITLSLIPKIFRYITTPGPDIGTTAFIAVGGTLLILSVTKNLKDNQRIKLILLSGVLFGLSALWRYHGLPLGVGFIIGSALISRKYFIYLVFGLTSIFLTYSIQSFFNIASGHGLLETATSFNVYITMYGVTWQKVSLMVKDLPHSVLEVIFSSPIRFLQTYSYNFLKIIPLIIPSLLGIFLLKDKKQVKISSIISLATILYLLVVSIGSGRSDRTGLPIIPFTIYQITVLASFAYRKAFENLGTRNLRILSVFAFVVVSFKLSSFGYDNFADIKDRKDFQEKYQSIQRVLIQEGVQNSKQVFSTSYDLYFPELKPYQPYNNGDWARYDMYGLNQEYPELTTQNMDKFLADCHQHAITHLVLDKSASVLMSELGQIYNEELSLKQLHKIADAGGLKVFRIDAL